jgi:hypothetical protein
LAQGEVAINVTDKKVWVGNAATTPVQLLGTGSDASFTNLAYTGTLTGGTGVVNLGSGQVYKDASGNVGVGTSSPAARLVSAGSSSTVYKALILRNGDGTVGSSATIDFEASAGTQGDEGSMAGRIAGVRTGSGTSGALTFSTTNSGVLGERMRITSAGDVAIGTTSTSGYKLVVSDGTIFSVVHAGGGASYYGSISNDPVLFIQNNAERMRINSAGNLLVGTTTEYNASKINVLASGANHCATFRNGSDAGYGIYFQNTAGTNVGSINWNATVTIYNTTSDYRLKTVIAPVTNAGQRIDALKPIEYDWNTGGRTRGFLAHQFAEVYPSSVSGAKDAVDADGQPVYQGMQPSTPEVMADLISEIQSLRKRVLALENK